MYFRSKESKRRILLLFIMGFFSMMGLTIILNRPFNICEQIAFWLLFSLLSEYVYQKTGK